MRLLNLFNDIFKKRQMIAYEQLCIDIINGNQTLFMRRDEVDAAWAWIDPIREAWEKHNVVPKSYTAGTQPRQLALVYAATGQYAGERSHRHPA